MKIYELFLTCPKGLEKVSKSELELIGIQNISIKSGGNYFEGSLDDIYRVNLCSRIGMNLLVKLSSFEFKNINEYYHNIYSYNWNYLIDPNMTIAIDSKIDKKTEVFNNSQFVNLKAKDAIVDKIRTIRKKRPSVSRDNPDIELKIFINGNSCDIYLNSSGDSLYIRGTGKESHAASINESLAAGLVYLSNWNKRDYLVDPMCGSGTICSEAALIKANISPGLIGRNYSFQKWINYDYDLFFNIKSHLKSKVSLSQKFNIYGSDIDYKYIHFCKNHILDYKFNISINYSIANISNFNKHLFEKHKTTVITNPPYGIRIGSNDSFKSIHLGFKQILDSGANLYTIFPLNHEFIENNFDYDLISKLFNGSIECGVYNIKNV
tara:strand:+ start:379 stop:1515 length:1137 start_codon:yes stop_codon:yes gene_type:complete